MSVKLDWDIEAEKGKQKEHKEDFQERSARYLAGLRLLMGILVFAGILAGIVYVINQRWEQINQRIEQVLADTVQAEVAALRVGNFDDFINLQRSATDDWILTQRNTFDMYQALKVNANVVLSGRILDVTVDGERGRVQVEEIIDGVPYVQTWFYWRYARIEEVDAEGRVQVVDEGGWQHVPPDYTFWGESSTIEHERFVVRYQAVDTLTAQALANEMQTWFDDACNLLPCENLPRLTVDILASALPEVRWADESGVQILIPSPYIGRARADRPFSGTIRVQTATLIALRFVNQNITAPPVSPADAYFLRDAIVAQLTARFLQVSSDSYLINSLISNYGIQTIPTLLRNLQAQSNISIVATVAGLASITEMNLDWRDYVLWRLNLEDEFIEAGNESAWTSLYDFRDETLRAAAYSRYNNNFIADSRSILEVYQDTSPDGTAQLVARIQVTRGFETGEEIVVFNLVNGSWLRAN